MNGQSRHQLAIHAVTQRTPACASARPSVSPPAPDSNGRGSWLLLGLLRLISLGVAVKVGFMISPQMSKATYGLFLMSRAWGHCQGAARTDTRIIRPDGAFRSEATSRPVAQPPGIPPTADDTSTRNRPGRARGLRQEPRATWRACSIRPARGGRPCPGAWTCAPRCHPPHAPGSFSVTRTN